MTSRVDIVQITRDDVEDVARFLSGDGQRTIEGTAIALANPALLRWFLFENPAEEDDKVGGWVMRASGGGIVGAFLCAPQRFRCGEKTFVVQTSSTYFVEDEHRGRGLSLFMRYFQLGNRYPLLTTTANQQSVNILERFNAYPVPGTGHELVGVVRWKPVLEEWLQRRTGRPGTARLLSQAGALSPRSILRRRLVAGLQLTAVTNAGELEALDLGGAPRHPREVTAVRDPAFLRWRYFEGPDPSRALFRFGDSEGATGLVGVKLVRRGYRGQIGTLSVLDLWGSLTADAIGAIASRLAEAYPDEADVVVFRGQPEERESALRKAHFHERRFPTPVGWCVDRREILPTRRWYLVPADGDTAF